MTEREYYYRHITNFGGLILEASSDFIIWLNKERTVKRADYFNWQTGEFEGRQILSMQLIYIGKIILKDFKKYIDK